MKVLGIRNSNSEIRIAILEINENKIQLLNKDSNHRLIFPANMSSIPKKIKWLYDELDQIYRNHKDISFLAVKTREYVTESKFDRIRSFLDSIVLYWAENKNITSNFYINGNLRIKKDEMEKIIDDLFVEDRTTYWNKAIKEAIYVGLFIGGYFDGIN